MKKLILIVIVLFLNSRVADAQVRVERHHLVATDSATMAEELRNETRNLTYSVTGRPSGGTLSDLDDWVRLSYFGSTAEGIVFRPAVKATSLAFRSPISGEDRFEGELYMQLESLETPGTVSPISPPVTFVIKGDKVRPEVSLITIGQTSTTETVRLSGLPTGDSTEISIEPFDHSEYNRVLRIKVERPTLNVSIAPRVLDAFGFQHANIVVSVSGIPVDTSWSFTVAPSLGIVDTNIVIVSGQNQVATLRLRSGQIGEDQIRVSSTSGITRDASVGATYRVPLLLLGFAIAGSLIGALIGWLIRGGVGRSLVGGFLWGLVTAALYAIGVNLVPSLPTGLVGHGAIFGVSAVAAAGGYVLNSVVDVG